MKNELTHIGMPRRSGRYPWGSGDEPYQNTGSFLAGIKELRAQGLSDAQIARGMDITTTDLRAYHTVAVSRERAAAVSRAMTLREKGHGYTEIGRMMGINESSVRTLLKEPLAQKASIIEGTAQTLKDSLAKNGGYMDIGAGVEIGLGMSSERLAASVAILKAEGYTVHNLKEPQVGTGEGTNMRLLCPPGTTFGDVIKGRDKIYVMDLHAKEDGTTDFGIVPPLSIKSSRLKVVYGDEGGADKDGVIELRRGVKDLDMGDSRYAQVRIAVDGTHYLKGMAYYRDDLPPGVDLQFNTNKSKTGNKLDALKPIKDDDENPFGSEIKRQIYVTDKDGKKRATSALNIVNEEGDWNEWSKTLSSQMLSKQGNDLVKERLTETFNRRKDDYDEIMSLTNPAVRKTLLMSFADETDAAATHLKAAALPRTSNKVILPIPSLKDNEVYAPSYKKGETVVLIRHPHGGTFEIPELKVTHSNPEGKKIIGNFPDAIGINPKVAKKLSGADFDGDSVLVIPNPGGRQRIKSQSPLKDLADFDHQTQYKGYPGMKVMGKGSHTQKAMGDISNLITDMTIRGASEAEISRAVKHSMVVIDAHKHKLNYKQSADDNNIAGLKKKYQDGGGASTLISKSKADRRIPDRKERPAAEGGFIDKATGKKMYVETGKSYTKTMKDGSTKTIQNVVKVPWMMTVDDAFKLTKNPRPVEVLYANYANQNKALANAARKVAVNTKTTPYSPSAKKAYAKEVAALNAKLRLAESNRPRERQAQVLANVRINLKIRENPDMDSNDLKKVKNMALRDARDKLGAKKTLVDITPREWEAIQAGAISNNKLTSILRNADIDKVKQLAMPRTSVGISPSKVARARTMLKNGETQADVAEALGVSVSVLSKALK